MNPTETQIGGWKTLDRLGLQQDDMLAERKRVRATQVALFGAVFGNEAGRKVLEIMRGWALRPTVPDGIAGQVPVTFDQIAPYATFRHGQNSIVELILQTVAEAERPPAQPRGK